MTREDEAVSSTIDRDTVERVLREHPVRVGVLFGSHARGTETAGSDVDVAVEFDEPLAAEDHHRARIDLVVDLMEALGVDDVDVTDLGATRPAIGSSALRTGVVLVGDRDRIERLRDRFESRTVDRSHEHRMRQFDEIIDRLEETV